MSFIPRYVDKVPYLSGRIRSLEASYRKHHGESFDYSRVWWNPPLEPKAAFDLERRQIEDRLGRAALVSLSDHDNIEAGFALELFPECEGAPISTEWTVPLGGKAQGDSFLHLGVHNLNAARARMLMDAMSETTAQPTESAIEAMLDELSRDPGVLVVINHPLWDEARFGQDHHDRQLLAFLKRYRPYIHALELNGLRHWRENRNVTRLAQELDLPVVGGGDRHGCEPNALVNLSRESTFAGFAAEVRSGAPTHTVYLDQYREPMRVRILQVMSDVLRTYDEFSIERRRWSDRIFYQSPDGTVRRLSDVWTGNGPDVIGQYVSLMQFLQSRRIRSALRLALGETQPMVIEP